MLVTHYNLVMKDKDKAFLRKIHWQYVIVDEGHRLKNQDCSLSKTLKTYVAFISSLTFRTGILLFFLWLDKHIAQQVFPSFPVFRELK